MGLKSDIWIQAMAEQRGMISPFMPELVRKVVIPDKGNIKGGPVKVVSYGLSSYGYDLRVGNNFQVFTNVFGREIDPKAFDPINMVERHIEDHDFCIVPPNSFALAVTVERLKIPNNVLVVCIGKSTYARCGIIVNVTPFEPGWEGYATLEISNTTPLPARIYAGEGLTQALFFEGDEACRISYADRSGKYQDQPDVPVVAKV